MVEVFFLKNFEFLVNLEQKVKDIPPIFETCIDINDIKAKSVVVKTGSCVMLYQNSGCTGAFMPFYNSEPDLSNIKVDFTTISKPGTRIFNFSNNYAKSYTNCFPLASNGEL